LGFGFGLIGIGGRLDSAGKSILMVELALLALMLFLIFRTGMSVPMWF
jgi:hypothetical protein